MSHPQHWAELMPERPAIMMASSGATLTYGELNARSNRVAHLLRDAGLKRGDGIVILMENHLNFLEICWGAQRSGLYFTPVSWRLKADEIAYILNNSNAKALFTTPRYAALALDAAKQVGLNNLFLVGGEDKHFRSYEMALHAQPSTRINDESLGRDMLYSSGTTGRPKGVKNVLPDGDVGTIPPVMGYLTKIYGFDTHTVNLTPAPLYHAGPLRYSMCVGHTGGFNIIMENFDAEAALALIERHRITHAELVPTMFVRLMKLAPDVRNKFDLSSLQLVAHGTGPCAPEVKKQIIEWLGPILEEQYGGTEGNGLCAINSTEWLAHPASVGKAVVGTLHIVGADGKDMPVGENGLVYFEGGPRFDYHGDAKKTAAAYSPEGWSTLGDIGYVDHEGYLYLTDRESHMIISGGVNIYPQEVENVLINHPAVQDVAVFGVPDADFGEVVMAVVHPTDMTQAGPQLAQELIDYCRAQIAHFKCPRAVDFSDSLPRHETGKIYKRLLKDQYKDKA